MIGLLGVIMWVLILLMLLLRQESRGVLDILEALLGLLKLVVLRTHAGQVTLSVVRGAILWLPARVPRLRRLWLHLAFPALLIFLNLMLILLQMLVFVPGHASGHELGGHATVLRARLRLLLLLYRLLLY